MSRADSPWSECSPHRIEVDGIHLLEGGYPRTKYGLYLWPSGWLLGQLIKKWPSNLRVLELGAGLGFASITAHRIGSQVTAFELDPETASRCRRNCAANAAVIDVVTGDWKEAAGAFDAIIGSDVLYLDENVTSAADVIQRCWTGKGPVLYVGASRDRERIPAAFRKLPYERRDDVAGIAGDGQIFHCDVWESK